MSQQIQLRRGIASLWTSTNPTLAEGECGVETDTGKIKFGDGSTSWNAKPYFTAAVAWGAISGSLASQTDLVSALADKETAGAAATAQTYSIQRANHTGTQLASTISDFATAADARIASAVGVSVQGYDGDLAAIAALAGTSGLARKTSANTWSLDTATYLTGNQSVTVSGDASGTGATSISLTLATVNGAPQADTFRKITVNGKGLVTATSAVVSGDITTALGFTPYNATNPSGFTANTGTVTTASVVSVNGFAGTVATAGTTPAITLSTTVTGILKGNGTSVSAAIAGDFPTLNQNTTGSASTLTTPRNINSVAFNGSSDITVTAAAGTLTGSSLAAGVTSSSLTTLGTLVALLLGATAPITLNGSVGTAGQVLASAGPGATPTWLTLGGGSGTVTSVSVVTANGVSGSVATASTTPAITLTLGAITPTSVAASGSVTGSNLSGTNTGDQTITLTGDVTGSGTGSFSTTLATVNANVGSFTNANITVDAKGRITAAANGSGGSGSPGGSTGDIQYNNAGAFAGAANVEISGDNLKLVSTTDPSAPTGGLLLYSKLVAGRHLPKVIGPSGIDTALQTGLHGNSVFMVAPASGTTAPTVIGGTLTTAATMSLQQTFASANPWQATSRKRFATSATAGNASGMRTAYTRWFRGNAAGYGGFFYRAQLGQNINLNGAQAFVGLCASTSALAAAAGSVAALVNMCGMGYDTTDSSGGNWQFYRNDGSGTATKVDLGANAVRGTTHGYDLIMYVAPNGSDLYVRIVNIHSNVVVLDTSYNTDLPAVNTGLAMKAEINNGAVASATNLEVAKIYIESDY